MQNPFRLLGKLFSEEGRFDRKEKRLGAMVGNGALEPARELFSILARDLMERKMSDRLAAFVSAWIGRLGPASLLASALSAETAGNAVAMLKNGRQYAAALALSEIYTVHRDIFDILALQGRSDEFASRIANHPAQDKEIVGEAFRLWERYNGDPGKSRAIVARIRSLPPELTPDIPRVQELAGNLEAAAKLYGDGKSFAEAARCFEAVGCFVQAMDMYKRAEDRKGASRMAECMGDLQQALEYADKPDRRADLMLRLGMFAEAREYGQGLSDPEQFFARLREEAQKRLRALASAREFAAALRLADYAESSPEERTQLQTEAREHINQEMRSASSEEAIVRLYAALADVEELAGNFAAAGDIALDRLEDPERASVNYEKALRILDAIRAAQKTNDQPRVAQLEKTYGNHLRAAGLYREMGDFNKACQLYRDLGQYRDALECCLLTAAPENHEVARLYELSGEPGKAIDMYRQSNLPADLEKALALAKRHQLPAEADDLERQLQALRRVTREDIEAAWAEAVAWVHDVYAPVLGIDFGTTNSVGALYNKQSGKAEIVVDPITGKTTLPSWFGFDEHGNRLHGEQAQIRAEQAPGDVAARVKRNLGETGAGTFRLRGNSYTNEEIAAEIINKVKCNAAANLEAKAEDRMRELLSARDLAAPESVIAKVLATKDPLLPFESIVLTIPAFFNNNRKEAIRNAGKIAGLEVKRLIHEPTAAAMAYIEGLPNSQSFEGKIAVLDLGGGTLDVSILDAGKTGTCDIFYEVESVSGDVALGGSDIDAIIMQKALSTLNAMRPGEPAITPDSHPREAARLRAACEHLKMNLSQADSYTLELFYFLGIDRFTFTMTRRELERCIQEPFLDRLSAVVDKAMADTGAAGPVTHFLLVGNACKMPAVIQAVEDAVRRSFPRAKRLSGIDPGTVVAAGAVLQAAVNQGSKQNTLLIDVVPYTLGVAVFDPAAGRRVLSTLIPRNTSIPYSETKTYTTHENNQTTVPIEVYQGESKNLQQNYFLGKFNLVGILPAPAGVPHIDVSFAMDANCLLTVTARDRATKKEGSITITNAAGLSKNEVNELAKAFSQAESLDALVKRLDSADTVFAAIDKALTEKFAALDRDMAAFKEIFKERVERNFLQYAATPEQGRIISDACSNCDSLFARVQALRDETSSTAASWKCANALHVDCTAPSANETLQTRLKTVEGFSGTLTRVEEQISTINRTLGQWLQTLRTLKPNLDTMTPIQRVEVLMVSGRYEEAFDHLESMAENRHEFTEAAFGMMLQCCARQGLPGRERYHDAHRKYGARFGCCYPDVNNLNEYVKKAIDSCFLVVVHRNGELCAAGSGFSVAPDLIVTNRHVVAESGDLGIISAGDFLVPDEIVKDPVNDLAILRIRSGALPAFRLGEVNHLEVGEPIVAIGFRAANLDVEHPFQNNLYASPGQILAYRRDQNAIFINVPGGGPGMSGSPVVNRLGEVVGVLTGKASTGDILAWPVHHVSALIRSL